MCDIFRQFFPASSINAGVWVEGPDGRRELDVDIIETRDGRTLRGVVECKDFNPATTGPVGIAYIDALDSKRRDLGLAVAFVCSNAGFTTDAIRKAKRVNIGLLGATIKGDSRIRFGVIDEIYVRHVGIVGPVQIHIWPADGETLPTKEVIESGEINFDGRPIAGWFFARFVEWVCINPIVKGKFVHSCRLKAPIKLDWPAGSGMVQKIAMEFELEGAWFAQTVQLDSTAGVYDWQRRSMRLAPSTRPKQLHIVGINHYGGTWIAQPPDVDWANRKLLPHEAEMRCVVLKNTFPSGEPALLTPHVIPEDLTVVMKDLPESAMQSVPGFQPDPVPPPKACENL